MPKMTLGIRKLREISGRDYGIEGPYWGPSKVKELHFLKLA